MQASRCQQTNAARRGTIVTPALLTVAQDRDAYSGSTADARTCHAVKSQGGIHPSVHEKSMLVDGFITQGHGESQTRPQGAGARTAAR